MLSLSKRQPLTSRARGGVWARIVGNYRLARSKQLLSVTLQAMTAGCERLSNDRRHGRLEIEFRWNDVRQFWPVSQSEQALGCGMWRMLSQRHDD
jgi:hypothetical protein